MKKNLIIVAHPDDELLWMGGTIQKLNDLWYENNILVLAKTGNARWSYKENDLRKQAFSKVCRNLNVNQIFFWDFPDTSFDSVRLLDIIKLIEDIISEVKPNRIYTHFYNDLNIDHWLTSRAVITAIRPYSRFWFVKELFLFEVLSTTEHTIWVNNVFVPNYYEILSKKHIDFKKKLLSFYHTEERVFPHPLSKEWIEILSKKRWMEVGVNYAEAFILYRKVS